MASGAKTKDILGQLYRQGFRCAYTGDPLTPETLSADHRVPVTRGGTHGIDNIALTSQAVNAAKGTMTADEFVDLCRKVAAHHGGADSPPAAPAVPPIDPAAVGDAGPCEILARLGYVDAAEKVRSDSVRLSFLEKRVGKPGPRAASFEEFTAEQAALVAELKTEIQRLRVIRSQLRAKTGWVKESAVTADN